VAKDFVVFFRRDVTPGEPGNDRAVRERKLPFPVGLDRHVIAQNRTQIIEAARFVGYGDQPPVALSGGILPPKIGVPLSTGLARCGGRVRDRAGQRYACEYENNPSH
jgi:hypothetical protein